MEDEILHREKNWYTEKITLLIQHSLLNIIECRKKMLVQKLYIEAINLITVA